MEEKINIGLLATIVIPTYKRPDRIGRAVLSALKQTYKPVEIIVVDDNGKDTEMAKQTCEALNSYISYGQIQYIQNEVNRGGSFSRNQGLNQAKGKYITFLDDDDEIAPEKIEKQVQCLEGLDNAYSACYTGFHKFTKSGKSYHSVENVVGNVYRYALSRSILVGSGSNLLVKTAIAQEIGGYDVSFARNQDLEFMARILKNYKLAYVDEDLMTVHYEVRETKRSYKQLVAIDTYFLNAFHSEIVALPEVQRKNVYKIVACERFRYAIQNGNGWDGFMNLFHNGVGPIVFLRYILYVFDRVLFKKSYGFRL